MAASQMQPRILPGRLLVVCVPITRMCFSDILLQTTWDERTVYLRFRTLGKLIDSCDLVPA
jgi:hypothetical protein